MQDQENLKREIIITADGSTTIHLPDLNEQYHSKHGAINEALHVFIKNGLHHILTSRDFSSLDILEIGFGTGLNAFITLLETQKNEQKLNYIGVEAFPVTLDEIKQMKYPDALSAIEKEHLFNMMHQTDWEKSTEITQKFRLTKRKQFFADIDDKDNFDLIYFDAFGARVQPDLWTVQIFEKMYDALRSNGVLVTYSAKGSVRRAMQEVGFTVERLPGPPGKREMLRAIKL
ncbi:tRNA (5-methylaminomethyl-2-thiouridine)(34)-methyltransferase MnmD [Aquimarina sp. 2201CG5-10]|uniref:tRNA (5-methylaminomethyl-2-thiouridine)(34)-methyltransferase MnmD n=1 Tax=Aquimarina callyspongiae TaxID=3098150 RepID=UPI002AB53361|nr:tRNA (5-methylaminomethyl-2-thiouridine)(34)-methyltransferase MnmD [Aquimarina sp. 2201CG5-10]MDY8134131.1 tRNA (5-methylaminomethyl-2-thiouridine)(34)-methyltransferase MnmD [Aquimarina sp. 2201CG5-10]